jgi:hypothetical protein
MSIWQAACTKGHAGLMNALIDYGRIRETINDGNEVHLSLMVALRSALVEFLLIRGAQIPSEDSWPADDQDTIEFLRNAKLKTGVFVQD